MGSRRVKLGWLGVVASMVFSASALAQPTAATTGGAAFQFSLDDVPQAERDKVRSVIDKPTLTAHGHVEVFACQPEHYFWLLDHPDQAVRLWRCLGVRCADIVDHGSYCTWDDGKGSSLRWHEVVHSADQRVWYAEGKLNPGFWLPTAAVQAVVVLHHTQGTDGSGRTAVRQQLELALRTDSHLLSAAARLIGASVPNMSQQYVGQIQTFYGALAWYLNQHPRHTEVLFEQLRRPAATDHELKLPTE